MLELCLQLGWVHIALVMIFLCRVLISFSIRIRSESYHQIKVNDLLNHCFVSN